MEVKVIAWVENPAGVVVSRNQKTEMINLNEINMIKSGVDKDTWGQICWKLGFLAALNRQSRK